ncbi:MAG: DUF4406 domain-containing protein [Ruminococcaceae bacterium]|nr:DUF4406 domain-containing protein [Oscillospiraceae bacterium]
MKKVFISGKITGEPIDDCLYKFNDACSYILGFGLCGHLTEIVNPLFLEGIYFGISHQEAMKICLEALKDCSHIFMLKDWKESKGAMMEHQFAMDNGIKIIYQ